jgi:hypothetical protein
MIDCGRCRNRGTGCADCVVSALQPPGAASFLGEAEVRALAVLAEAGLVPPLRLKLPGSRDSRVPRHESVVMVA